MEKRIEKLTVDHAIQKGHQLLTRPVIILLFVGFGLTFASGLGFKKVWLYPTGILSTFVLMILWWSFMVNRWKLWAFERCRNVHELKRRAINEKLILPDKSRLKWTAYSTKQQRMKWESLEKKFELEDIPEAIADDGSIPHETEIYYSKVSMIVLWAIAIGFSGFSLNLLMKGELLGGLLLIGSVFLVYQAYQKAQLKGTYLLLNSKGIKILDRPLIRWEAIQFAEATLKGTGKSRQWYLVIDFEQKNIVQESRIELEIND